MVYRGHIRNGVAVLEGDVRLPDGTLVEVAPVEARAESAVDDPLYRLHELAVPSGIPDLAMNIDHYLYGHPKVDDAQP
jgi:hypothetical protein